MPTQTRPNSEQLRLQSVRTGEHNLDTYLEACEHGDRTLSDLLGDLFETGSGRLRSDLFEWRLDTATSTIQVRSGDHASPSTGWVNVTPWFENRGAFQTGTAYNPFDLVLATDHRYYLVTAAIGPFASQANFIADAGTVVFIDLNAAVTGAATSANNAQLSASSAATSATNAQNSAANAQTSASGASTSATSAQNSASAAANSATNAQTSATSAANSATNAQTSASNAQTSASSAATSASNAAISATNAANSAAEAANAVADTVQVDEANTFTATQSFDATVLPIRIKAPNLATALQFTGNRIISWDSEATGAHEYRLGRWSAAATSIAFAIYGPNTSDKRASMDSTGEVFGARLSLNGTAPDIRLLETDEASPSGQWRFAGSGGSLHLQRAGGAGFTSLNTLLRFDQDNSINILNPIVMNSPASGSAIKFTSNTLVHFDHDGTGDILFRYGRTSANASKVTLAMVGPNTADARAYMDTSGKVYAQNQAEVGSTRLNADPSGAQNAGMISSIGIGMKLRTGSDTNPFQFLDAGGTAIARVDVTASNFTTTLQSRAHADARYVLQSSSQRYKTNITPAPAPDLSQLEAMSWVWGGELVFDDDRIGTPGYGLIAEDLAQVAPDCVTRDEHGRVEGINALATIGAIIDFYNAKIAALEARLAALESA